MKIICSLSIICFAIMSHSNSYAENKALVATNSLLLGNTWVCEDDDITNGIYRICNYFPIKSGYRWEYTTGERYITNEKHTHPAGYTGQLYATDTYEYAMFMSNSKSGLKSVGNYELPEGEFYEFPTPLTIIPESMTIGQSYNYQFFSNDITIKFEGVETITVPAGTFQTIRYRLTGIDDENYSYYTDIWFAKNIGIIKVDREDVYPPNNGCMLVCRPDNNYTLVNTPAELISINFEHD